MCCCWICGASCCKCCSICCNWNTTGRMSAKVSNCASRWRSAANFSWAIRCMSCCCCLSTISLCSFCCCSNHCNCLSNVAFSALRVWCCWLDCCNCSLSSATASSDSSSMCPSTLSSCLRWLAISFVFSNASCPILVKILELVRYSNSSPRSLSRAFKNAVTSDCANSTARVNCSKLSWVICCNWVSTALTLSASTTPSLKHVTERCTFCNLPFTFSRARLISQRAKYCFWSCATKHTSANPCAVPRRNTVRGELVNSSEPSISVNFPSLPLSLGIWLNRARHMASKMVDLPAPVLPTIATSPALASGSASKSI